MATTDKHSTAGPGGPPNAPGRDRVLTLDGPPSVWLPRLNDLLLEQYGLCAELDGLSAKQSGAVSAGNTDALLRILGERQVVIDRVAVLNTLLEPFRTNKQEVMTRLSAAERDALNNRIARINQLVESVRARDDGDRKMLESQRLSVSGEISGVSRGRGAMAAYGRLSAEVKPRFQDRRG